MIDQALFQSPPRKKPLCVATERRFTQCKRNYFRTAPPFHLFEEANYALPGYKSMLPDQGQTQGKEATFPININTDIFG